MNFLAPLGLLGLLALPVLLWLHRKSDVPPRRRFPSIRFWQELRTDDEQGVRKKFRVSWRLWVQLAAAALLSLAAAKPIANLPEWMTPNAPTHYIIVLDASLSMLAGSERGTRLEQAKSELTGLASRANDGDAFTLIRSGELATLASSPSAGHLEFLEAIQNFTAGDFSSDLVGGLVLARSISRENDSYRIEVYTDGAFELPAGIDRFAINQWRIYADGESNQAILSAYTSSLTNGLTESVLTVANFSASAVTRDLVSHADGVEVFRTALQIPGESIATVREEIPAGSDKLEFALEGSDSQAADDLALVLETVGAQPRIDLFSAYPDWWRERLGNLNLAETNIQAAPGQSSTSGSDLTIFDGYLPDFWPDGIVLVFNLPSGNGLFEIGSAIPLLGEPISLAPDFLKEQELEGLRVEWAYSYAENPLTDEVLVSSNGQPLWMVRTTPTSRVYVYLGEIPSRDYLEHASFPLVIARLAGWATGSPAYGRGSFDEFVAGLNRTPWAELTLGLPGGDVLQSSRPNQILTPSYGAGRYTIDGITSPGRAVQSEFVVNGGSITESDIRTREWAGGLGEIADAAPSDEASAPLAGYFFALAFFLIVFEDRKSRSNE